MEKGILPESGSKNSVSCANSGYNCKVIEIYVVGVFWEILIYKETLEKTIYNCTAET